MSYWKHLSEDAIATNTDPLYGGIVDTNIVSGLWFAVPQHDDIPMKENFATKADAIAYITGEAQKLMRAP